MSHTMFDLGALEPKQVYKLIIGTVVPRPIAWVTTRSPGGVDNAAPYSFFNALSADPPILALGVENHQDTSFKDTTSNIRLTEEFTINIVDVATVAAMNITAIAFPPEVDELQEAGLTAVPGSMVSCPRILEAPVAIECRRHMTLELSRSREIVLGLGVCMHIRSDLVNDRMHVDQLALGAVGRMGGHGYARTGDLFDLPTPKLAEYRDNPSRFK